MVILMFKNAYISGWSSQWACARLRTVSMATAASNSNCSDAM